MFMSATYFRQQWLIHPSATRSTFSSSVVRPAAWPLQFTGQWNCHSIQRNRWGTSATSATERYGTKLVIERWWAGNQGALTSRPTSLWRKQCNGRVAICDAFTYGELENRSQPKTQVIDHALPTRLSGAVQDALHFLSIDFPHGPIPELSNQMTPYPVGLCVFGRVFPFLFINR
jgi:hypothetical protein